MKLKYQKLSKQLGQKEIPICVVCNKNPAREGLKTCSKECSKAKTKAYHKAHMKAYSQRPEVKAHMKAYYQKNRIKILRRMKNAQKIQKL